MARPAATTAKKINVFLLRAAKWDAAGGGVVDGAGCEVSPSGMCVNCNTRVESGMLEKSVTLIGMPGAGKSHIGKLLSEALSLPLLDLDAILIKTFEMKLQTYIDTYGDEKFINEEDRITFKALADIPQSVISPGGSIIYCARTMQRLKEISHIVYLDVPLHVILERIGREPRGVVGAKSRPFNEIFAERTKLYAEAADLTLDGTLGEQSLVEIIARDIMVR